MMMVVSLVEKLDKTVMKVKATILTLKLVLFLAFADLVLNLFVVITIMTVIMIIILKSIYFYMALRTSTSSTSAFSKLLFYFHVIIRLLKSNIPEKNSKYWSVYLTL